MALSTLLLPILVVAAFILPPASTVSLSQDRWWWWEAEAEKTVGPGCVDGDMEYPGVPAEITAQCPSVDEPEPVLPTNMNDCSSYYECNDGVATLICCPAGLLWDIPMRVCDTPPHVNCGTRPILPHRTTTTTTTTTSTTSSTSTTSHSTTTPVPGIDGKCDDVPGYIGNLPVEDDCTKYYFCDGSGSTDGTVNTCGVGVYGQMVFNPTTQVCDDQWHYPCENHQIYQPFIAWF